MRMVSPVCKQRDELTFTWGNETREYGRVLVSLMTVTFEVYFRLFFFLLMTKKTLSKLW